MRYENSVLHQILKLIPWADVRIQLAAALIGFLLLRLAQPTQKISSPLAFARLVRINLMHRRRLDRLLDEQLSLHPNPNQMLLQWT